MQWEIDTGGARHDDEQPTMPMPNVQVLDAELDERIRRLVQQELRHVVAQEARAEVKRVLQEAIQIIRIQAGVKRDGR